MKVRAVSNTRVFLKISYDSIHEKITTVYTYIWLLFQLNIAFPFTNYTMFSVLVAIETDISGSYAWWLPYLFVCLGAVLLVLTVTLILFLCIKAFKSKSLCHFPLF